MDNECVRCKRTLRERRLRRSAYQIDTTVARRQAKCMCPRTSSTVPLKSSPKILPTDAYIEIDLFKKIFYEAKEK